MPIVVPGLSKSSSSSATPTSPTSVLQEAEHPASTRSESWSSTVWVSPSHENPLLDLPGWLEEFTENLVDERVPAHRDAPASSSRESASEPRVKVVSGSGKHSIFFTS